MRNYSLHFLVFFIAITVKENALAQTTPLKWAPEQTMKMKNISAVRPSPNGKKVLYTVREAVMTDERSEYINQIFLCNSDGSNTVQLTRGDKNSSNPRWSPDGKWIAYTSSKDGKNNLYLLPVDGGESEKLTDTKTSIGEFYFSADGSMIAYLMQDAPGEAEEKNKKGKADWYFMDEDIKQSRLYVLSIHDKDSSGKYVPKKLTAEYYNVNAFSWSPDGKTIAYSYGKSPEVNDNVYSDIATVELATAKSTIIANSKAGETNPLFSPDGKFIAYACTEDLMKWAGPVHVNIFSVADKKTTRLAATPDQSGNLIGWTADSKALLCSEGKKTLTAVYKLSLDGKQVNEWSIGIKDLLGIATLNTTASEIGFVLQNTAHPGEAYISSTANFEPVKISGINDSIAVKFLPKTEIVRWKSFDGTEIEGLLTYPVNYQAGQKVPMILNVHGGPAGVFTQNCVVSNGGTYPIAAWAEMGYAVLRPNPRGSDGYGTSFRMANERDWGGADFKDLMTGVDYVIKMGVADPDKLGVAGWSYGGFMSSWIVGHTDRFKAASIGAPVVDLTFQNLTDDIAGFLPSYMNNEPWADWAVYNEHSPLRFVQNVKTPVQLQHGEADLRVPFSQGIMFYHALKRRGIPVRMLALPRQPHGPTEPKMLLKVQQTNVEWFNKYLGTKQGF